MKTLLHQIARTSIRSIAFCLLLIAAFQARVQSQSLFFPWNDQLTPRTEFSGRYAFRMHQVVPELNALSILTNDSRLLIYDLDHPESPKHEIQLEVPVYAFCFSDGYFHCAGQNEIYTVDPHSFEVSIEDRFEGPEEFFPQFYYQENGINYFLTPNEMTYILKGGQLELIEDRAWVLPGNHRLYAEIKPEVGIDLTLPAGDDRVYTANAFSSRGISKILTVTPLGFIDGTLFLDIELEDGDTIPTRLLVETTDQGEIIKRTNIPFMYYIQLSTPWSISGDHIYYTLTTPKGFYLVRDGNFSDINTTMQYHYNYSLPLNPAEGQNDSLEVDHDRSGSNCVTRTQIASNGKKYLQASWVATSSNWVNSCTTIPGGTARYRTSWSNVNYSSNGSKSSTPYKWGGFTKWTDWLSLVASGKKTGNSFTANNSVCSGTAYSSVSDTYVIGVDCSGFVSRAWELSSKKSTQTLPDISTYLGESNTSSGFSALKKGDIVNLFGSHTRICLADNPTGTATFIEASADNWNVRQGPYSYTELSGYKSYRYNNVSDNRIKLSQSILLNPSTVQKNCPLTVTYKVKNEGSESWTGKVLLVLIQSNGVEAGLDGPYTITLNPNQTSALFTFSSPAFNYPTGTSKIEVRVKNTVTSCNYQLYYPVESNGSYANPKVFTIYNNCSAPPLVPTQLSVNGSRIATIRLAKEQPADIFVYDITGRTMNRFYCNDDECEVDLSNLPGGVYFASIIQGRDQVSVERFVIPE